MMTPLWAAVTVIAFVLAVGYVCWELILSYRCASCKKRKHMGLLDGGFEVGIMRGEMSCRSCYNKDPRGFWERDGATGETLSRLARAR